MWDDPEEEDFWSDESSDEEDFNPFARMVAAVRRPPSPLRPLRAPTVWEWNAVVGVRPPPAHVELIEESEFLLGSKEYLQWATEVFSEDLFHEMNDWIQQARCPRASETLAPQDLALLREKVFLAQDWGYHTETGAHERYEEFTHGDTSGLLPSQEVSDLLFRNLEKIGLFPERTTLFYTDTFQKLDRAIDFLGSLEGLPNELLNVQRLWSAFLAEGDHLQDLVDLAIVPLERASIPLAFLVVAARVMILVCLYPCASDRCIGMARYVLQHLRECLQ